MNNKNIPILSPLLMLLYNEAWVSAVIMALAAVLVKHFEVFGGQTDMVGGYLAIAFVITMVIASTKMSLTPAQKGRLDNQLARMSTTMVAGQLDRLEAKLYETQKIKLPDEFENSILEEMMDFFNQKGYVISQDDNDKALIYLHPYEIVKDAEKQ